MDFRISYTVLIVYCLTLKCSMTFPSVPKKADNTDFNSLVSETPNELSSEISSNYQPENLWTPTDKNLSEEKNITNKNESDEFVSSLSEKQNDKDRNDHKKNDGLGSDINDSFKKTLIKPVENRKTAESNNYISQMIPNHNVHKQSYGSHTGEVVVQKLGNTADDQGKVIYIPVYDSPNQNGHSSSAQNFHNKLGHNSQHNANKKAVGFIGVVFVDKMKPENAIIPSTIQQKGYFHGSFQHPNTHLNHQKSQSVKGFKQQVGKGNLDDEDYRLLQHAEIKHPKIQWHNQELPNSKTQWQNQNKFTPGNEQWQSPGNTEWQNPQTLNPGNGQWQNNQMLKTGTSAWQNPNLSNNGNVQFNFNNVKHNNQKQSNFGNSQWKNQKMFNPSTVQWKNPKTANPNNPQWHNKNIVIGGNTWEVSPGVKMLSQEPIVQGQITSDQRRPWSNDQTVNLGQAVYKNQNQIIISKGNPKMNDQTNFQNNRPISENPLFPTRGKPIPKTLTPSNNNGNIYHEKKNFKGNVLWIDESGQLKNNPKHGHQQNFNTNNIPTSHTVPETNKKGSVQYIPVIQHVIIEKSSVNNDNILVNKGNHDSGVVHQGGIQNFQHFDQLPKFVPNPVPSGYDQNNPYNGENENNMNYNAVSPQIWNSLSENGRHQYPDLNFLQTPNNLIPPNHSKRNGRMPYYEHASGNSMPINQNSDHQKIPHTLDQGNLKYNGNSNDAMFENTPHLITSQHTSHGSSQQPKGSIQDNPLTQEFSSDPQIREAFRVAGIYLQNKNNLQTNTEDLTNPHSQLHTINSNVQYNNEARNTRSPHLDDIKATTDQRYNALVHEKNNNLNVIKTGDHLFQLNSPDIAQFFGQAPNGVNDDNRNKQIYNSPVFAKLDQLKGFPDDSTRNSVLDSFKMKDAVVYPRQQAFVNQNHAKQHLYNAAPLQIQRNPLVINSNKNDDTIVLTGYGQKDSAKKSSEGHLKYPERFNQRNYENNLSISEQRSDASNNDGIDSDNNLSDETSKLWHPRYPGNYPIKSNSGKSENANVSNLKDVDGSDSNGFGGESFW